MILLIFTLSIFVSSKSVKGPHGGCHSAAYYGQPNNFPISDFADHLKLINTVENGKIYEVTVPQDTQGRTNNASTFSLLHLWGTPYEMGFAQGSLRPKEVYQKYMADVWRYFEDEIEGYLPGWIPKWLEDLILNFGLKEALELTYDATKHWTNPAYIQELQGFSDATDVEFMTLVRIHMLPGLTQGACSMVGAWGKAVDGLGLLQLRALDWDMDGPFIDNPQITVYHPNTDNGHAFANVGMMGFIGGLTGMSEEQLGISEIGVSFPDDSFGRMSRLGLPFIWLLRDILQYAKNIEEATNMMVNTHRTCDLILGVGDGKSNQFTAYQYSYSVLNEIGWDDLRPVADWHPQIEDVVYFGMDWLCPSYMEVLANQTKKYYGKLKPEVGIQYITSVEESGDTHLAWYALDKDELYVSFGAKEETEKVERWAYHRQFTKLDCKVLWAEEKP